MKVISLSSSKTEVIAKEIETLSQTNNIKTSNLVYAKEKFYMLVYILPEGQVGGLDESPKAPFKMKKETLEKWKSEDPSTAQLKVLKQMGYTNNESLGMSKFKAHKIIGGKGEKTNKNN